MSNTEYIRLNTLAMQIIMISHISELIESADRVFDVSIKNGVSQVEVKK